MKFSILACDRRLSKDFPFILRGNYEDCAKMAYDIGFQGMEIQIQDPRQYDVLHLRKVFDSYGLEIPSVNTGLAFSFEGLSMTSEGKEIRRKTVERLQRHADMCKDLNSRVLIGFIRGRKYAGESDKNYEDKLTDSMQQLLEYAENIQVPIVFEQINRRDGDVFNSTPRTMEFVEKFQSRYLQYNGDTYHMLSEDDNIEEAITRSIKKLVLFHVSDVGRLLPDDEHFDFYKAADVLRRLHYKEWLTLECKPLPTSEAAAKIGFNYLKRVFG